MKIWWPWGSSCQFWLLLTLIFVVLHWYQVLVVVSYGYQYRYSYLYGNLSSIGINFSLVSVWVSIWGLILVWKRYWYGYQVYSEWINVESVGPLPDTDTSNGFGISMAMNVWAQWNILLSSFCHNRYIWEPQKILYRMEIFVQFISILLHPMLRYTQRSASFKTQTTWNPKK